MPHFINNCKLYMKYIIPIKKSSDDFFKDKNFKNIKFDYIFIDGCHKYEYVKKDFLNSLKVSKINTVIGFDDYFNPCGVKKAVDEICEEKNIKINEYKNIVFIKV